MKVKYFECCFFELNVLFALFLETKTYILQFIGNRVAQPSVKNFQMIIENDKRMFNYLNFEFDVMFYDLDEEQVIMQFGRVDKDTFTCDFRYPLSPIQAFAIALSSFDSRFARE